MKLNKPHIHETYSTLCLHQHYHNQDLQINFKQLNNITLPLASHVATLSFSTLKAGSGRDWYQK